MTDAEKLKSDMKQFIKEAIFKVCKEHGIKENEISYKLDFQISMEVNDHLKRGDENVK